MNHCAKNPLAALLYEGWKLCRAFLEPRLEISRPAKAVPIELLMSTRPVCATGVHIAGDYPLVCGWGCGGFRRMKNTNRQQNGTLLSISMFQKDLLHIKVMAWAFGTNGGINLHFGISTCIAGCKERCQQSIAISLHLEQNTNLEAELATAVAFKLVCPNRQSESPADVVATLPLDQLTTQPVTLQLCAVLIHSTELLEL
ncbi:hypothetical protein ZWY2020_011112 [Hordeum vulgare]|nr:hypothetical protein ZWY2020_011112 [Hordeum vulgare]